MYTYVALPRFHIIPTSAFLHKVDSECFAPCPYVSSNKQTSDRNLDALDYNEAL